MAPKAINLRFWQGAGPELDELRDIFELRAMVEGAVAELAAQRRDDDDLRAMTEHLQAMDDALESGVDGTVADDNFHIALARATHNAYIGRLVEFLGQHFSDSRKLAWYDSSLQLRLPQASQHEHRALLDAIIQGDAEAARRRALEHLRGAAGRLGIPLALDIDGTRLPTRVPRKR